MKPSWKYSPDDETKYHFFVSSIAEWRTGTDASALITAMKRSNLTFMLWFVPLPENASYDIRAYSPKVEGATLLGYYSIS